MTLLKIVAGIGLLYLVCILLITLMQDRLLRPEAQAQQVGTAISDDTHASSGAVQFPPLGVFAKLTYEATPPLLWIRAVGPEDSNKDRSFGA